MKQLGSAVLVTVIALAGTNVLGGGKGKDQLKGTWTATDLAMKGKKVPAAGFMTMTFAAGNKLIMKGAKKGDETEGTYKADPSKKPPQIDITVKKGDKTDILKTIYQIKGDMLEIAFPMGEPPATRPKNFDADGFMIFYLKKQ